ncbi:hypothetical protein HK096_010442, partial [Nowakowskiella sp. JEL0078]
VFVDDCRVKISSKVTQLEPLFNISHIQPDEFLQIWNVCEIKGTGRLNKEQFIIFSHILNARRRGKQPPVGLPLSIKEQFLREDTRKSNVYVRPGSSSRPDDQSKEILSLETEISTISDNIRTIKSEELKLEAKILDLKDTKDELTDVQDYYKKKHISLEDENTELGNLIRRSTSSQTSESQENQEQMLLDLKTQKAWLENKQREILNLIEG